jgi:hypothetical protein
VARIGLCSCLIFEQDVGEGEETVAAALQDIGGRRKREQEEEMQVELTLCLAAPSRPPPIGRREEQ